MGAGILLSWFRDMNRVSVEKLSFPVKIGEKWKFEEIGFFDGKIIHRNPSGLKKLLF